VTQRELDRRVARATGESLGEIRRRGFGLADAAEVHFDPEPCGPMAQYVDWDAVYPTEPMRPFRRRTAVAA
jgi:hypothetical protein